ncbi:hypothetical protein AOLI_G00190150 [Acnodon oligacanthus]
MARRGYSGGWTWAPLSLLLCALLCGRSSACPALCTCSGTTVDCHGLGLKSVPRNIPRNTERLELNGNNFTRINKNDFAGLKYLRFNKQGTPVRECSRPSSQKHGRSRSFGGLIKRKVLGNQLPTERTEAGMTQAKEMTKGNGASSIKRTPLSPAQQSSLSLP